MAYIPPLNGGRINATIAGNTAGAGALVSTGTLTLAGGNNITLSQAGNAITVSGGAGGGTNTLGMSNLGNTSGTTGVVSGSAFQYLLAGGNNITLSQSINGSSGTLTISAASQSLQTQSRFNLTLGGNSTSAGAGYLQVSSGVLSLVGGNNITLSQNGNAITVSGTDPSAREYLRAEMHTDQSTNLNVGDHIKFDTVQASASTSILLDTSGTSTQGRFTLAGGKTYKLHALAPASGFSAGDFASLSYYWYDVTNGAPIGSAGFLQPTTRGDLSQDSNSSADAVFTTSGTTVVEVRFNHSVSIQVLGGSSINSYPNAYIEVLSSGGSASGFTASSFNPLDAYGQVAGQQGQSKLHLQPMQPPNLTFNQLVFPVVFSGSSNSTGTISMSMYAGIYTSNASTLSLLTSFSTSNALTHSGNTATNNGLKLFTMGASGYLSQGQYWMGILSVTAAGGNNATISQMLVSQQNSNLAGFWGQVGNVTNQYTLGLGTYSSNTTGIPSSIPFSSIGGTGSQVLRQPVFFFQNGTA
jgi:hypothetical protein